MRTRRAAHLDWQRIGGIAACLALLCATLYVVWLSAIAKAPVATDLSGHDDTPFDLADSYTRSAFLLHREMLTWNKVEALSDYCLEETYRLMVEPGLSNDHVRMVRVRVAGQRATITEYGFSDAWHVTSQRVVEEQAIEPLRRALDAALGANIRPAINDHYVDAARTVVETCRRSRYHFFARSSFGSTLAPSLTPADPEDEEQRRFEALAQALLQVSAVANTTSAH